MLRKFRHTAGQRCLHGATNSSDACRSQIRTPKLSSSILEALAAAGNLSLGLSIAAHNAVGGRCESVSSESECSRVLCFTRWAYRQRSSVAVSTPLLGMRSARWRRRWSEPLLPRLRSAVTYQPQPSRTSTSHLQVSTNIAVSHGRLTLVSTLLELPARSIAVLPAYQIDPGRAAALAAASLRPWAHAPPASAWTDATRILR